jgi:ubiquinone/menaquinone biosynthesis C-methylase UbiE
MLLSSRGLETKQARTLVRRVDLSETSLQQGRARVAALGVANVVFHRAALNALPFESALHRTAVKDGVFCYTSFKAICKVT